MLPVFEQLIQAGLINVEQSECFSLCCRDESVKIFRDQLTGVIYIDPSYQGRSQIYYSDKSVLTPKHPRNDMDWADTRRRAKYLGPYIAGKRWCDFGCGPGFQLRESACLASDHLGLELNLDNRNTLQASGFNVSENIMDTQKFKPQVISLFHVLEHLEDPKHILNLLYSAAEPNAVLIVEVPHAKDTLLHTNDLFKSFSLWSEHLVLHTRESLKFTIQSSGWEISELIALQRYPIWNHLHWLIEGNPSGLKSAVLDSTAMNLQEAYEQYLISRDLTDTLLVIARKKEQIP